jgi:hypothetical protein
MFGHVEVERPAFLKLKASFPNGLCHMGDRVSKRVFMQDSEAEKI